MMLSQFYNRRSSLQPPRKEEPSHQQEEIINSFYAERKSRSSKNVKQHNLLRKNISYFQKDQQDSPPKQQPPLPLHHAHRPNDPPAPPPAPTLTHLSKPPIPRTTPIDNPKNTKPTSQAIPPLPLKQLSHNPSQLSSNFSSLHLSKTGSQQQDFKAHLKNELNRRINIQHYLSELSEDNKENPRHPPPSASPSSAKDKAHFKLKYNYDASVPQRLPSENVSEQFSRISFHNGEERPIHESRQSSISSLLQQDPPQNNFEFSRNSLTDRIQHNNRDQSFSNYRNSVPTLGDSARRSEEGSRKQESAGRDRERGSAGRNVLTGEELSQLQQNSHPIREEGTESQPTTQKHALKYFDPEVQAEYKRKIGDLEREVEALRGQRKREDKFIHSIQKMRMLMDGAEDECSLKELWRWIKALPQRK